MIKRLMIFTSAVHHKSSHLAIEKVCQCSHKKGHYVRIILTIPFNHHSCQLNAPFIFPIYLLYCTPDQQDDLGPSVHL